MKKNQRSSSSCRTFFPCEWIDPVEHFHLAQWALLGILIMRGKIVGVGWINLLHFFF